MGTISLAAIDIASGIAGFLFGKIAPNIFGKTAAINPAEHKVEAGKMIALIEAKLAVIKAEFAKL